MLSVVELLFLSLSVTGPICLMLVLGIVFKRIQFINDNFIEVSSKLVFRVSLPIMLFMGIVTSDHDFSLAYGFIVFSAIASIAFFLLSTIAAYLAFPKSGNQGVIVQGSYRANTAIIGIAYITNAYGGSGLATASLYVAVTTFIYNVQAILCLSPKHNQRQMNLIKPMLIMLLKNPLVIAIILGFIVVLLDIKIPEIAITVSNYCAQMSLPLALICTGGSLNLKAMGQSGAEIWYASGFKLVLAPLVFTGAAYLWGFREIELAIVFFMNASPVAATSYIMARAMGRDEAMAANIVALTTILSTITVSLGLLVLTKYHLVA